MNKILLSASFLLTGTIGVYAIPADPTPRTIIQPDGSKITVSIRGDEYSHKIIDTKGRALRYDAKSRFYKEVSLQDAEIPGMGRVSLPQQTIKRNNYPTLGKQSQLVVLVEFADQPFFSIEDPYDFYDRMLNEEGFTWDNGANGSARDFYLASSEGKFDPTFVVVGPVRLSGNATYYGEDYGTQDARMGQFIEEALNAIDDEVDFADFDKDNDGTVDNIFFFYSGYGQADHPEGKNFIWPHSADAEVAWGKKLVYDGKEIHTYACSNEVRYSTIGEVKPTGIGTFVHEFGHVLGLADHYDTIYNQYAFGIGSWDTMASGSYNNNMHTPPLFNAFERAEIGWMDYTDLDENIDTLAELPWIGNGEAMGYRVKVAGKENEYFVLENRQQCGWDRYLPGHGLLIWHVDMDEERWLNNTVNTDPYHQLLDIVEVDGKQTDSSRGGDVMPGTDNITTYTLISWDNEEVITIDDVEETDANSEEALIRILVKGSGFTLDTPGAVEISEVSDVDFKVNWSEVGNASYYLVNISGEEEAIPDYSDLRFDYPEEIRVKGLEPETTYTVSVTAGRGSVVSEAKEQKVTTSALAFSKRTIDNIEISEITEQGFTLTFDPVRDAEDHLVTLYDISRDSNSTRKGYGFDEREEGMPSSWESTASSFNSTEGGYGAAAPSLRIISDGGYVMVSYPEMLLDKVSFWHADNGSSNRFVVEIPDGESWKEAGDVVTSKTGAVSDFELPGVEKVRIRLDKKGGYALLDDIYVEGRAMKHEAMEGYNPLSIGNSGSYSFIELKPGQTYGVSIVAVCDGESSVRSEELTVVLLTSGVEAVGTDENRRPLYYINAAGIRTSKPSQGFNIAVYSDGSVRKFMTKH